MAIRDGLYGIEQSTEGLAGGVLPAEAVIMTNVPLYKRALKGQTLVSRKVANTPEHAPEAEQIPHHRIVYEAGSINRVMRILSALPTLDEAKRLQRFLPIEVPTTQKSFRALKLVAEGDAESFQIPSTDPLRDTIAMAADILRAIDKHVKDTLASRKEIIMPLEIQVAKTCREEASLMLASETVDREAIKKEIVDEMIHHLKRDIQQTNTISRPVSTYEILVNQKMSEIATNQGMTVAAELERELREQQATAIHTIAKTRLKQRVTSELRLARLVRQRISERTNNNLQTNHLTDTEISKRAENSVQKSLHPQTLLEEEDRLKEEVRTLHVSFLSETGEYKMEASKTLSEKEYSMLKRFIEQTPDDSKTRYRIGEVLLRRAIADQIPEEKIIEAISNRQIKQVSTALLLGMTTQAVDIAVERHCLHPGEVLTNPAVLAANRDDIVTDAIALVTEKISQQTVFDDIPIALSEQPTATVYDRNKKRERQKKEVSEQTGRNGIDFSRVLKALEESPVIKEITLHNLINLIQKDSTLSLAIEFCPLYAQGPMSESRLLSTTNGLQSILDSRVGKKWIATTEALRVLSNVLQSNNRQLTILVTFADMAVLAGTRDAIDETILARHGAIYEEQFAKLSDQLGIQYSFRRLSDLAGDVLTDIGIDRFVLAENGEVLKAIPRNLSTLLTKLGFTEQEIPVQKNEQQARHILRELLMNAGGNTAIARGLLGAYGITLPLLTENCDLHLGMERSQNLLDLSTLILDAKPAMNILVK